MAEKSPSAPSFENLSMIAAGPKSVSSEFKTQAATPRSNIFWEDFFLPYQFFYDRFPAPRHIEIPEFVRFIFFLRLEGEQSLVQRFGLFFFFLAPVQSADKALESQGLEDGGRTPLSNPE